MCYLNGRLPLNPLSLVTPFSLQWHTTWPFSLLLRSVVLVNFSRVSCNGVEEGLLHAQEDRPLFVQFGATDPEMLLKAAVTVQEHCDYVDINLGCPQRVAKRGNYGAFLMEDLPLIQSMATHLATNLTTPVSCKIRIFPDMGETLAYARMLEDAGCSLLAVHGRTREHRADWEAITAVRTLSGSRCWRMATYGGWRMCTSA